MDVCACMGGGEGFMDLGVGVKGQDKNSDNYTCAYFEEKNKNNFPCTYYRYISY